MMVLRWTEKAQSDLARLYDFLAPVNKLAATRVIQSLIAAPVRLLEYPRIGERLEEFDPREVRRIFVGMSCVTKFGNRPSTCCAYGIREKIGRARTIDFRDVPCRAAERGCELLEAGMG